MAEEFKPKRAVKAQVKLKIAVQGPSGSGKTEGALALAYSLLAAMGYTTPEQIEGKILVVDTENESASLYADRYIFDTIPLSAPYTTARYYAAMNCAVTGGYQILIVDGISPQWAGSGGILRRKDKIDASGGEKSSFNSWAKFDPEYESFVELIKAIPIDAIMTMRAKSSYVLQANDRGKLVPTKIGMAPIQRDGLEFEFSLVFEVDMLHNAVATKDRTRLFQEELEDGSGARPMVVNLKDPGVGQRLQAWRASGAELAPAQMPPPPPGQASTPAPHGFQNLDPNCITTQQGQQLYTAMKQHGKTLEDVKAKYGVERLGVIPKVKFEEVLAWVQAPRTEPKKYEPGEENCRAAALALGISDADLYYELSTNRGDWNLTLERLNQIAEEARQRAEAEEADAVEARLNAEAIAEQQQEQLAMAAVAGSVPQSQSRSRKK